MNAVMCSVASKEGDFEQAISYVNQAIVALNGVKSSEKLLVTNIEFFTDKYKKIFIDNSIKVIYKKFDDFVFPDNVPWKLAYYKLCALKYVVDNCDYEAIINVDTDVLFIRDEVKIFNEFDDRIMLYYLPYSSFHQDRKQFLNELIKFYNLDSKINYFGGEFIGGKIESLKKYLDECHKIYENMKRNNFYSMRGDEFILSLAAHKFELIFSNPYIDRYWTGRNYEVSTNYYYSEIVILHMPNEKNNGFEKAFKLIEKNKFISLKKFVKIFHLPKHNKPLFYYNFVDIKKKIRKLRN